MATFTGRFKHKGGKDCERFGRLVKKPHSGLLFAHFLRTSTRRAGWPGTVALIFDRSEQRATIGGSEGKLAMTIDLKPEQQRVIDLAVRSGAYENPDEVLDQAFEIIREQLDLEDWMLGRREEVAAHIAAGFAQAERGELIDEEAAVELLRQRRAQRMKPQG
jgi:hypothetical protein